MEGLIMLAAYGFPKLDYIKSHFPKKMILRLDQHMQANKSLYSENQSDRSYMQYIHRRANTCRYQPKPLD